MLAAELGLTPGLFSSRVILSHRMPLSLTEVSEMLTSQE